MVLAVSEKTFTDEVLKSPTPVLVSFWAPWCGLCRLITPMLTRFQAEWDGQIKLVSVNADENLKLANTYRLTTLPTIIVFDGGRPIHRLDRFRNRDDIRVAVDELQNVLEAAQLSYTYTAM